MSFIVCAHVCVFPPAFVFTPDSVSPLQSSVGCYKSQKSNHTQRGDFTKETPSQEKAVKCYAFSGSTLSGRTSA